MHCLSFLDCDFILSPVAPSLVLADPVSPLHDLLNSAFLTLFPQVLLTTKLWHQCLGHPGIESID
jgi:hypothetical protein